MTEHPDTTLQVLEEQACVEVRRQVTGIVRVRTETAEFDTVETADLVGETVEITRIPMDAELTAPPPVRIEGDVTILPVYEERVVVETRLFLTEEIHIRRVATRETVEVPVRLRKQHATIDRLDPETAG